MTSELMPVISLSHTLVWLGFDYNEKPLKCLICTTLNQEHWDWSVSRGRDFDLNLKTPCNSITREGKYFSKAKIQHTFSDHLGGWGGVGARHQSGSYPLPSRVKSQGRTQEGRMDMKHCAWTCVYRQPCYALSVFLLFSAICVQQRADPCGSSGSVLREMENCCTKLIIMNLLVDCSG